MFGVILQTIKVILVINIPPCLESWVFISDCGHRGWVLVGDTQLSSAPAACGAAGGGRPVEDALQSQALRVCLLPLSPAPAAKENDDRN